MQAPSADIRDMLEAASGLALEFNNNLFIGLEPPKPDDATTIFDTPGSPPQLTLGGQGEDYFYPSVQVRVRNRGYIAGWTLINDIKVSLHGRAQETWNGTLYSVIAATGDPALLDFDDNGRPRFVVTFDIQRR